jgi:hypothetical protein
MSLTVIPGDFRIGATGFPSHLRSGVFEGTAAANVPEESRQRARRSRGMHLAVPTLTCGRLEGLHHDDYKWWIVDEIRI